MPKDVQDVFMNYVDSAAKQIRDRFDEIFESEYEPHQDDDDLDFKGQVESIKQAGLKMQGQSYETASERDGAYVQEATQNLKTGRNLS